jgi:hypothetical protein
MPVSKVSWRFSKLWLSLGARGSIYGRARR